jgi:hypothetical protein
MRGYREAVPIAEAAGIDLIPGIETTVYWPELDRELDVLGYWIDAEHPDLLALEAAALANLHERAGELCALLAADGYLVTVDDGLAINPRRVGPLEVVASLLKKGLIADLPEGWVLFRRHWGQVSVPKLTITRSIATIRAAGGIPVLAHPCRIRPEPLTAEELTPLVSAGLGAIEINHPDMNDAMKAHYRALAQQFDLPTSGGTDEHGWPEGFPRMGTQPVTVATAEALRARAGA